VHHLRHLDDTPAAVSVFCNVQNGTGERCGNVRLRAPAGERARVTLAVLSQAGGEEWHVRVRRVALVCPRLVVEVELAIVVGIAVQAEVYRDHLLHLVHEGRGGVSLRGEGLAVEIPRVVAVHVSPCADPDRPGAASDRVVVRHDGEE